jgi:hypothetical protein
MDGVHLLCALRAVDNANNSAGNFEVCVSAVNSVDVYMSYEVNTLTLSVI